MTAYRYRARTRYRPSRYRGRYPYRPRRLRRPGGNAEKAIGALAGLLLAGSLGAHAAASRHAPARAVTVTAAVPVAGGSEAAFTGAVLADLGAPDDQADAGSLAAWFLHEYPAWPPGAANNALDTTLPMPGSWNYNTFDGDLHVQAYPTASEGAQATALTLEGGYPLIVSALRSGAGICGDGFASELGAWSGDGYQEVC